MQVESHQQKMTNPGFLCVSRTLLPEARHDGLSGSSSNHVDVGIVGLRNDATPSEGAKRRYEAHFISKLTDCDGENSETDSSLDFAKDCGYITDEQHVELTSLCIEIGKMLGSMINNPGPFLTSGL
ncbi:MAG: four helix bundle protein [Verrucomicrobia bacterium]|nr:four helix bundle protein [Verrucomicrobiota bacterium]